MAVACNSAPVDPNAALSDIDVIINDLKVPSDGESHGLVYAFPGKAYGRGLGNAYGKKRNADEIPAFDQNGKPSSFYYASNNDLDAGAFIPIAFGYGKDNKIGKKS